MPTFENCYSHKSPNYQTEASREAEKRRRANGVPEYSNVAGEMERKK